MAVLAAALAAWGLLSLWKLPVELQPNAASETVTVTINNVVHAYAGDSAEQLRNVAYACWGS